MFRWLRQIRARLRYRHFDRDLRQELDVHQAMSEDAFIAEGLDATTARAGARRALGNVAVAREDARRVWFAPWLESVWQDTHYAVRGLRSSPGFTTAVVLILLIGIGLNAGLFTVTNALLFRPWPVPNPDRVVTVFAQRVAGASGDTLTGVSPVEYRFLRDRAETIDLTATREASAYLSSGSVEMPLGGRYVSGNYFPAIRMPVALGRGLTPADDREGQPEHVAVLGHQVWQSAFGADQSVVGRVVQLNRIPFTIVGVTSAGALEAVAAGYPKIWLPLGTLPVLEPEQAGQRFLTSPDDCCVQLAGRLRGRSSRAAAAAELSGLHGQFPRSDTGHPAGIVVTSTITANQPQARRIVPVFGLALAAVALVLLLACANVGNMQLARSMARRREIAVRLSLGASRRRIVRQLLTESAVLSLIASTGSWAFAMIVPIVVARVSPDVSVMLDLRPDARLLIVLLSLAFVATVLTGLAPSLRSTRRLSSGRYDRDGTRLRLRGALLVSQVAISLLLLVCSSLISRGVTRAASLDPGFDIANVRLLAINANLPTDQERRVFTRQMLEAVDHGPGPTAGASALAPLGTSTVRTGVRLCQEPSDADRPAWLQEVTPAFFSILRIRLVAGRFFNDAPEADEVIINETLARQLSPAADVLGQTLAGTPGSRIVGVVADARLENLGEAHPTIFRPISSVANFLFTRDDATASRLQAIVAALNPKATVTVQRLSDNVQSSLDASQVGAQLTAALGLSALGLAGIGIFGVFSYVVTERTREIGVRLAVGARKADVLRLLVRRAAIPLGAGIGVGLLLSFVATPTLRSNIYSVNPYDPASLIAATAVIVIAAVLATALPARRALRIDPAITLRHE